MTTLMTETTREFGETGTENRVIRDVGDLDEDELIAIGHLQEISGVKAAIAAVIPNATFEVPDEAFFHRAVEHEAEDLVSGDGQ